MPTKFETLYKYYLERLAEKKERIRVWILAALSFLVLLLSFYVLCVRPPAKFPVNSLVNIKEQSSLSDITKNLYDHNVIKSPVFFRAITIIFFGETSIQAGDYLFDRKLSVFSVIKKLANGDFGLTPVKVTLPEGMTVIQMSSILKNNLLSFDVDEFVRLAQLKEGYNFPDTYLFTPNVKPQGVIKIMQDNFEQKIKTIESDIKKFKKPLNDIVIMASILEAEARTMESRKIISGILWRRLAIGMPLQVDAPFQYIIGKNTFQLTTSDLKFDSPYNTYKYKGLPPGAINNPGLDAIVATINPVQTNYLYYLSDVKGNMHYATTYKDHLLNKEKYIK